MSTHLYLFRHGEAHSNVHAVLGGVNGDQGLTALGVAQAEALGRRLRNGAITPDVLYASTLPRARQTAAHVAEALNLPITWDDDLHELRPGDADGMSVAAAREQFAGFDRFLLDAFTPIAPGGESWGSFQMRVSAALERITLRHHNQTIAVVAHGGVIEVSFLHFLGLGPQARSRAAFHVRNTAITHWRLWEASNNARKEWQLIVHNDHQHLEGIDSAHEPRNQ